MLRRHRASSVAVFAGLLLAAACRAEFLATTLEISGGNVDTGPMRADRLRVGERRASGGIWLRWKGGLLSTPGRVRVRFRGARTAGPGAPVHRTRLGPIAGPARWLHGTIWDGADALVDVPLARAATDEVLWMDLASYPQMSGRARLIADPGDRQPLGDRHAVVLIHGLLWDHPAASVSGPMQAAFFECARRHPLVRGLRPRTKLYGFYYPSWSGPEGAAVQLREAVRELLPDGSGRKLVLVGHSMGGLVARLAMNLDNLGDRVAACITAATPHHGSFVLSLSSARGPVREHVGRGDEAFLLEGLGAILPDCPSYRALFWDDFDGVLGRPGFDRLAIPGNPWLAAFNRSDRYLDRVVAVAADCARLGSSRWLDPFERIRWAQDRYFPGFGNTDPLVPLSSARFDAAPCIQRRLVGATNHFEWAVKPRPIGQLLEAVADVTAP